MDHLPRLAVHRWPDGGAPARQDLLVLALHTPDTPHRDKARGLARSALVQILGTYLDCPPDAVALASVPGQPLRLDLPGTRIGLSLSHEPGMSLAAIHLSGPVGVDLMAVPPDPVWRHDIPALARDYLGPAAAEMLATSPPQQQPGCFAQAWTQLEASLKCLGEPLQEWTPALHRRLSACRCYRLELSTSLVGAVSILASGSVTPDSG